MRTAFEDSKTKCVFSSEWDTHSQKTYEANFGVIPFGDITKIDEKTIPKHNILLAGFPCQPFSMIGKREGLDHKTQGNLFFDILRILKYCKPDAFLLENVPGLLTIDKGETFKLMVGELKKLGYSVDHKVLNASDFSLPQTRKRLYIVGMREGLHFFHFPEEKKKKVFINEILEDDPQGYTISKRLQKSYIFKANDGHPQIVDKNSQCFAKTLVASYHKIQRITGTFVKGGETGLRLLSETECKRLMGFSDDFIVPVSRTQMYRQFGNSVAIPVVASIAQNMKKALRQSEEQKKTDVISCDSSNCDKCLIAV